MNSSPHIVRWDDARAQLGHGYLLLLRANPRSLASRLISRAGRSIYSHAARVAWRDQEIRCLEVREWHGAREVSLLDQVVKWPGRWDVFEPNPGNIAKALGCDYDARAAVNYLRGLVGKPYGWVNLLRIAALHTPGLRMLIAPPTDDEAESGFLPVCSHAQALADRIAGVDPVVNLADRVTEPADLARSLFYRYKFTLEP